MSSHYVAGHYSKMMVPPAWTNGPIVLDPASFEAARLSFDKDQKDALLSGYGTVTPPHDQGIWPSRSSSLCGALTPQQSPPRVEQIGDVVHQRPYTAIPYRPFSQSPSIYFRVNGRDGINLGRALKNDFTGLEGRDEPAFSITKAKLSFRLEWVSPLGNAYPSYSHQITIRDSTKDAKSISVAKLAHAIAKELRRFIELSAAYQFSDADWRVGPGFIELGQIELIRLDHVSEGSVQAELRVARY
ncbi:hypothetical protein B0H21DRAFT_718203 [Amylocystis lapponica]|nr:hypothetical protein B0H21DRAFT_718203 [Amylocystis lapponica]